MLWVSSGPGDWRMSSSLEVFLDAPSIGFNAPSTASAAEKARDRVFRIDFWYDFVTEEGMWPGGYSLNDIMHIQLGPPNGDTIHLAVEAVEQSQFTEVKTPQFPMSGRGKLRHTDWKHVVVDVPVAELVRRTPSLAWTSRMDQSLRLSVFVSDSGVPSGDSGVLIDRVRVGNYPAS